MTIILLIGIVHSYAIPQIGDGQKESYYLLEFTYYFFPLIGFFQLTNYNNQID